MAAPGAISSKNRPRLAVLSSALSGTQLAASVMEDVNDRRPLTERVEMSAPLTFVSGEMQRHMRVLHEDVVTRISLLQEGREPQKREPN